MSEFDSCSQVSVIICEPSGKGALSFDMHEGTFTAIEDGDNSFGIILNRLFFLIRDNREYLSGKVDEMKTKISKLVMENYKLRKELGEIRFEKAMKELGK